MKKLALFTLAASMFSAFTLTAQDEAPKGKLTISGYVDMYYSYNLNNPPHSPGVSFENATRIFDIKHNEFSLGLIQTKLAYTTDKSEAVIDLTYGPNAYLGNFGNVFGTGDLFIKQAYFAYNATDKLKFTVGQFGTHIGYELIDAPLNFNYSLSYLFGNGPFYHTGAKASYMLSDKVGIMAGIVNGWDAMYDFNKSKSVIAQLYLAPKDGWDVYINYIGGNEKNGWSFPTAGFQGTGGTTLPDSIKTGSHLFDLTTTYQVTDAFKIGLNAAYGTGKLDTMNFAVDGKMGTATWYGAALYLNYSFSDVVALGLRAEHFNDKDGVRYISNAIGQGCAVNSFTLTGDIKLKDGHFSLKPEARIDILDVNDDAGGTAKGFTKYKYSSNGEVKSAETTNTQVTIGMAAIYAF
ncbi:MAG: porin [Cytophagaceae bacterium]|jgi:hypothetical protein|nr:porin [Cytophagaceae bacterium]